MANAVSVYILMGTCGCGKTTIAELLIQKLKCHYIEGDTLHPKANVDKMFAGIPLTDEDRWGWLASIRDAVVQKAQLMSTEVNNNQSLKRIIIVTCSSLRKVYRDLLREVPNGLCRVVFIYLKGSYELIDSRMKSRQNHFMASNMLRSQWQTLEEPNPNEEAVIIQDISIKTEEIVERILTQINNELNNELKSK